MVAAGEQKLEAAISTHDEELEAEFTASEKEEQDLRGKLGVSRGHVKRLRGREQGMRDAFAFALHQAQKNSSHTPVSDT